MRREIRHYPTARELSEAAAEAFVQLARDTVARQEFFSVALAGGSTPCTLYELLAGAFRELVPWERVHLFWGDERCVPPTHPDSNYAMAYEAMVGRVPVLEDYVHRMPGELEPPAEAAAQYEKLLRHFFLPGPGQEVPTTFDLVLLGIGPDGHTASLFPGSPALLERERWVVATVAPPTSPVHNRLTLTLPALNRARQTFFLVAGAGKQPVVTTILTDPQRAWDLYPSALIAPQERCVWFLDAAAASAGLNTTATP